MARTIFQNNTVVKTLANMEDRSAAVDTHNDSENVKIDAVITIIKSEKFFDKTKLYEAFCSSGFQEVTDVVGIIIMQLPFKSCVLF